MLSIKAWHIVGTESTEQWFSRAGFHNGQMWKMEEEEEEPRMRDGVSTVR